MGKLKTFPYQIGVGGLILSDYEKELVNRVLLSNRLTYGPVTKQFESDFAKLHDCRFGLFMNSGTSALHAAYFAAGIGPGNSVLIPPITFVATGNAMCCRRSSDHVALPWVFNPDV